MVKLTKELWRKVLLAGLSSLGLWLAFPNFNLEILAFFSLIPLLCLIYGEKPLNSFYYCFGAGTLFYLLSLSWVTNTMVNYGGLSRPVSFLILFLLALYLALYFGAFGYIFSKYIRGLGAWEPLGGALLWVSLEYLRTQLTGFPWNSLGYSQYKNLLFIQISSLGSFYIISFLLFFGNAAGAYCWWHWRHNKTGATGPAMRDPENRGRSPLLNPLLAFLLAVGCSYAYGYWAMQQPLEGKPLKVAVAQGNIDQGVKWSPAFLQSTIEIYQRLSREAAQESPDLLVWPEAAMPFFLAQNETYGPRVLKIAGDLGIPILTGADYRGLYHGQRRNFNSAFLLTPRGDVGGRYDKMHLVPFGEYVPWQKIFFFVDKMVEVVGDFAPGEKATVFSTPKGSFGVTICYENIFPALVRKFTKNGADFLVNITNDAWFGASAAPYQHLSMSAFRAIENRRWVVRAANTGVSAIIDPYGRIVKETAIFQEAYFTGQIQLLNHQSFYLVYGDVFAVVAVFLLLALIWSANFYPFKKKG
jgi:apolipoprotein N-acyltransferase